MTSADMLVEVTNLGDLAVLVPIAAAIFVWIFLSAAVSARCWLVGHRCRLVHGRDGASQGPVYHVPSRR